MLGKTSIKPISLQTPEEKLYIIKLIAHQKLGPKWIYYRKIKRAEQGLALFREKSLMEQMKATRAALRFTTKNARKLYRMVYLDSVKEIKAYTGLKTDFPELHDTENSDEVMSLNSEHDAVIICWTPIKFMLPVLQLRSKGLATQRHTEGLAAKLFFKVAGFYADPANWDRYKLNLYLRRITKTSSYQDITSELEPLKSDLEKFVEAYEPFKFGKASLSKDVAQDRDAFDDAMGVESFDSQLNTLYWYHFIYLAIEQFIFRYYLTLTISTPSKDAIRYLTTIFDPVFKRVIENRNVFLGSFETDRTKRSFRVPYQKLVKVLNEEPLRKNIKTQMGAYETLTYSLPLLDQLTLTYELEQTPAPDSEWATFIKHYILNIDRPPIIELPPQDPEPASQAESDASDQELEAERQSLTKEKEELVLIKKELSAQKTEIATRAQKADSLSKNQKLELEEEKSALVSKELDLDKKIYALKEKFKQLEKKKTDAKIVEAENQKRQESKFVDPVEMVRYENEVAELPVRQFVLLNIMTSMINCTQHKRHARYLIVERFKERVQNDQELESKRIEEIRKKAEKKLRDLKKRKSKLDRLKQSDTVSAVAEDINKFEKGIEDRIEIIKKDSMQQLMQQKKRLNALFEDISKEKTIDLGQTPRNLWKLIVETDPEGEFAQGFPLYVSQQIQNSYVRELEPLYKHIFDILDLSIKDKLQMIQALEKSGIETSVKLTLSHDEEKQLQDKIDAMKEAITKQRPDLFISKIIFATKMIPVNSVFNLGIDNKSLNTLLRLKLASPKSTQSFTLEAETIKSMLELNSLINPLPKYSILQAGREKEKQTEKRINSAILNSLLAKAETSKPAD